MEYEIALYNITAFYKHILLAPLQSLYRLKQLLHELINFLLCRKKWKRKCYYLKTSNLSDFFCLQKYGILYRNGKMSEGLTELTSNANCTVIAVVL